ncbi:hypothetical protein HNR44_000049 [Geomicrobium halophilum]|uniref:Pyrroline-5-carboxylate reductase catalytic N-terminal domain-containing protein n=1 Tax=Geomicrobium halophilum TaxID=549000 RepID=A0A841PH37_9BACL|nr:hypothetical protein [Geomicrobium halophilum]MBB6448100.1 hypothetical protein [Geomicrobium halophilum]
MLIIGYGKLGRAMISRIATKNTTVDVFNRTKAAVDGDPLCNYVPPEDFHRYSKVLIALPAQAYDDFFIRWNGYFSEGTCFFYCATNVMKEDMDTYMKDRYTAAPCKLAGHATMLQTMGEGAFVFENDQRRTQFQQWCGDALKTMVADERDVQKANRIATEESLRALLHMEERLQQEHVSADLMGTVSASIPGGIAYAHKYQQHGHFARDLLQKWKGGSVDE